MNLQTEQTDDWLTDRIRQNFPAENPADVLEILELYGTESYERETERVRLAVLKLCGGDLNELREMIMPRKQITAMRWRGRNLRDRCEPVPPNSTRCRRMPQMKYASATAANISRGSRAKNKSVQKFVVNRK